MDRGYLSFKLYDDLTDGKRFFVTRLSEAVTFTTTHILTQTATIRDELGFLGSYRADRSKHLYRLVTITTALGTRRYLTNVRKPRKLTPAQIVQLYARRWDIELAFKLLKRELGLHLIWSTSWPMITLQIWGTLLIAQVALVLRLQLALRARVAVFDVSLPLLLHDLPRYVARGEPDVLGTIAARGRYGGIIRPSRRKRLEVPTNLPWTPPPKGLRRIQIPRYAGKQ
jgi:Transposase DDE domain